MVFSALGFWNVTFPTPVTFLHVVVKGPGIPSSVAVPLNVVAAGIVTDVVAVAVTTGRPFEEFVKVKSAALLKPPPGAGLETLTGMMALTAEVTATVIVVAFTKVAVFVTPLTNTVELFVNPLPVIVTVTVVPATALLGVRFVMIGKGYITGNSIVFELPPPGDGLLTTTW